MAWLAALSICSTTPHASTRCAKPAAAPRKNASAPRSSSRNTCSSTSRCYRSRSEDASGTTSQRVQDRQERVRARLLSCRKSRKKEWALAPVGPLHPHHGSASCARPNQCAPLSTTAISEIGAQDHAQSRRRMFIDCASENAAPSAQPQRPHSVYLYIAVVAWILACAVITASFSMGNLHEPSTRTVAT